MLEEWSWDPGLLAGFARHYQTDQPIPADVVRQLERATGFGHALDMRTQMAYARISCRSTTAPAQVDTDSIVSAVLQKYTPVPPMADTHMQTSFTHLNGVLGVLLHLHVVAGHREGSVQQVRPVEPARAGADPRYRSLVSSGAVPRRRRCWWRTSWGGRSASTPGGSGSRAAAEDDEGQLRAGRVSSAAAGRGRSSAAARRSAGRVPRRDRRGRNGT